MRTKAKASQDQKRRVIDDPAIIYLMLPTTVSSEVRSEHWRFTTMPPNTDLLAEEVLTQQHPDRKMFSRFSHMFCMLGIEPDVPQSVLEKVFVLAEGDNWPISASLQNGTLLRY